MGLGYSGQGLAVRRSRKAFHGVREFTAGYFFCELAGNCRRFLSGHHIFDPRRWIPYVLSAFHRAAGLLTLRGSFLTLIHDSMNFGFEQSGSAFPHALMIQLQYDWMNWRSRSAGSRVQTNPQFVQANALSRSQMPPIRKRTRPKRMFSGSKVLNLRVFTILPTITRLHLHSGQGGSGAKTLSGQSFSTNWRSASGRVTLQMQPQSRHA
jgi:hypothetical protein